MRAHLDGRRPPSESADRRRAMELVLIPLPFWSHPSFALLIAASSERARDIARAAKATPVEPVFGSEGLLCPSERWRWERKGLTYPPDGERPLPRGRHLLPKGFRGLT